MSNVLITYKNQNKLDKYHLLPSAEQTTVDNVIANFIQELVTEKGSSLFDREYGSTFMYELGPQVNIYKIDYILKNSIEPLKAKYGITAVTVGTANFNTSDGFLDIDLKIEMDDMAVETHFNFVYGGLFTDQMIVEMD